MIYAVRYSSPSIAFASDFMKAEMGLDVSYCNLFFIAVKSDDNSAHCKNGCQVCRMQRVVSAQIYPSNCWNNTLRISNRTAEQMEVLPDFSVSIILSIKHVSVYIWINTCSVKTNTNA